MSHRQLIYTCNTDVTQDETTLDQISNTTWTRDSAVQHRDVKFDFQNGSDCTNLGLFKISFSTFWLAEDILKVPIFVPLRSNLFQCDLF